mgnify:FL=1
MDNKFLHKVIDQIITETIIDYDRKVIETPFRSYSFVVFFTPIYLLLSLFSDHCKNVYGLNEEEINYVWNEYKEIIISKIKNNG